MKIVKWLDSHLEEFIMVVLLCAIFISVMLQVIMRNVFRNALFWPEELARFSFIWTGLISLGYCIRKKSMLRVDLVYGFFGKPIQRGLDVIGQLVSLLFYAYAGYYAFLATITNMQQKAMSPALGIPMYIVYASVPVGFLIGFLRTIQATYFMFRDMLKKDPDRKGGNEEC